MDNLFQRQLAYAKRLGALRQKNAPPSPTPTTITPTTIAPTDRPQTPNKKRQQKNKLILAFIVCLLLLPSLMPNTAFANGSARFGTLNAWSDKARQLLTRTQNPFKKSTTQTIATTALNEHIGDGVGLSNQSINEPSTDNSSDTLSGDLPNAVGDGTPQNGVPQNIPTQNAQTQSAQNAIHSTAPELLAILQAEFALHRGDTQTALTLYKQESHKENATAVFERALGLSMQNEPAAESLSFAKAWQDKNQDHIPVWFFVTHLALKSGDYETAAANINMILEYDPNADLRQVFEGILPTDPIAQKELSHALEAISNDNSPSLSALKAGLFNQLGEHQIALLWANQALHAQPKNLAFLTLKADMLQNAKQSAQLQQFLTNAIKHTTGDTQKQLYLYQIRHLIDQSQLKTAFGILKTAHKKFADDHEITLLAGLVGLDIKAYDEAINLLTKLSQSPSYEGQARYYLGIAYERQNKLNDAIVQLESVKDPEWLMSARKKALTHLLNLGELDRAIQLLTTLQQDPLFASEAYILHADILVKLGKQDAAKALLSHAINDNPDDSELLYVSTRLLDDNDDYAEKLDLFLRLRQLDPYNLRYQFEQARLMLLKNPLDSLALTEVLQVHQTSRNNPDTNGTLYEDTLVALANNDLVRGNFSAVIARLDNTYQKRPNLPMGELLLRAYYALGNQAKVAQLAEELTQKFGTRPTSTTDNTITSDNLPLNN